MVEDQAGQGSAQKAAAKAPTPYRSAIVGNIDAVEDGELKEAGFAAGDKLWTDAKHEHYAVTTASDDGLVPGFERIGEIE